MKAYVLNNVYFVSRILFMLGECGRFLIPLYLVKFKDENHNLQAEKLFTTKTHTTYYGREDFSRKSE